MSIPAIGGASMLPATPAAAAAPGASALPFLLMMLAPSQATEQTPGPAPEEVVPAGGEAVDANEAPPLIGWLLDSLAMATPSTPAIDAAPPFLPAADPGGPIDAPPPALVVLADVAPGMVEPTAATDAETEALPFASVARAEIATEAAAFAPAVLPELATENPARAPTALVDAVQQNPGATPVMLPSLPIAGASAAAIAAPPPAPVDGPASPLVAGAPDFGADLGERIAWQLDQGLGEATIELHPAELGALTIRIETQAQQAQVHIVAADPAARALLSQCLPQLRELLGASGLTLTRGQVESGERRGELEPGVGLPSPRMGRRRVTSVSLVDAYA